MVWQISLSLASISGLRPHGPGFNGQHWDDILDEETSLPPWIGDWLYHGCRETGQSTRRAFDRPMLLPHLYPVPEASNDSYTGKSEWRDNIQDGEGSSPRS